MNHHVILIENQEIGNQDHNSTDIRIKQLMNSIYRRYEGFMDRYINRLHKYYETLSEPMKNHQDHNINVNEWKINQFFNQFLNIISVKFRLKYGIVFSMISMILHTIYYRIIIEYIEDSDIDTIIKMMLYAVPSMLYYSMTTSASHANHLITHQKLDTIKTEMKEEIQTEMTKATTEMKEEIQTEMTKATIEMKEEIQTEMTKATIEMKEEIKMEMAKAKTEMMEEIKTYFDTLFKQSNAIIVPPVDIDINTNSISRAIFDSTNNATYATYATNTSSNIENVIDDNDLSYTSDMTESYLTGSYLSESGTLRRKTFTYFDD